MGGRRVLIQTISLNQRFAWESVARKVLKNYPPREQPTLQRVALQARAAVIGSLVISQKVQINTCDSTAKTVAMIHIIKIGSNFKLRCSKKKGVGTWTTSAWYRCEIHQAHRSRNIAVPPIKSNQRWDRLDKASHIDVTRMMRMVITAKIRLCTVGFGALFPYFQSLLESRSNQWYVDHYNWWEEIGNLRKTRSKDDINPWTIRRKRTTTIWLAPIMLRGATDWKTAPGYRKTTSQSIY